MPPRKASRSDPPASTRAARVQRRHRPQPASIGRRLLEIGQPIPSPPIALQDVRFRPPRRPRKRIGCDFSRSAKPLRDTAADKNELFSSTPPQSATDSLNQQTPKI